MAKSALRKTLAREQWADIFGLADPRYPSGSRDRAMYWFMLGTGIRVGELVHLRFKDVNVRTGKFKTPREGKTGQRNLSFPDSKVIYDALNDWLETREAILATGVQSDYFFCTSRGSRVNERNFHRKLSERAERAGIPERVHPHMMRHSYASARIHEGINILDLQAELGHLNIKTTMVYLHQTNTRAVSNMRNRSF